MTTIVDGLLPLAVDIDTLRPMQGNPRKGDVDAVKRSLKEFGQHRPIVAREDGTIISGHHIHAAAVSLGWTEVAVLFVNDDETRARARGLADNRTADLGSYDHDLLLAQLVSVADVDFDLLEAASYTPQDIEQLALYVEGPDKLDPEGEDEGGGGGPNETTCPNCGWVW